MASEASVSTSSVHSHSTDEQGPHFKPQNCPPNEPVISVHSNDVLLLPLSNGSLHQKLEVAAYQSLHGLSTGQRCLPDDIVVLTSSAGVIFGRIPNELSDTGFTKWLESFIDYISHNEQAMWWHTDHSGPWACYVFVPMNKKRTEWMYPNTKYGKSRPLKILGMLDTYAESKPWQLNLHGWEQAENRAAEIWGKCYVPTSSHRKRRRRRKNAENRQKQSPREEWKIRFIWDPVGKIREVRLRDEEWKDELVLERVEMSLI